MSNTQLATTGEMSPQAIEQVLINQDLTDLAPDQRLAYYQSVCTSLGLNPLTRPFAYIELNNKLTLYALKDCTEQLRSNRNISLTISSREVIDDVWIVTARATNDKGRTDESIGAVPLKKEGGSWEKSQSGKRYFKGNGQFTPLVGEDRANAMMKAETKAKRRVTLSICGLGMLDETEVGTISGAVIHDAEDAAKQNVTAALRNRDTSETAEIRRDVEEKAALEGEMNWHHVECHYGGANGPLLGKTIGEILGPDVPLKRATAAIG